MFGWLGCQVRTGGQVSCVLSVRLAEDSFSADILRVWERDYRSGTSRIIAIDSEQEYVTFIATPFGLQIPHM